MNKFKCKHCNNETNTIIYISGERKCLECLSDRIRNKKVSELNV